MPKALARAATSRPMRPKPMTPSFWPRNSVPMKLFLSQAPVFMFVTTLVSLRYQQGVRVTREAAQMCLVVAAILIACGAIGGRYLGFSAQTLAAKAAMCGAAWGVAYLAMPASDRLRLRSGVLATAHRLLRKRSPDIA